MDMNSPWEIDQLEMLLRLGLALGLGGLIGLERETSSRAAGLRTNILVCVGSALIMLLSMYGFAEFANEPTVRLDPARLAAQVISGIGFLGAGVIIFNGISVTGLTTAATLWVVAAIGLASGAGFYYPAITATFIVLFSLLILNKVENKWIKPKSIHTIRINSLDRAGCIGEVSGLLQAHKLAIRKINVEQYLAKEDESPRVSITIVVNVKNKFLVLIIEELRRIEGITDVAVE
jgi:putative Mg2+ transporter-C (MgtC) family protein